MLGGDPTSCSNLPHFEQASSKPLSVASVQEQGATSMTGHMSQMHPPTKAHVPVGPGSIQWTFPLLKNTTDMESEDYEKLKTRLRSETSKMTIRFTNIFTSFFESLSDRNVSVKRIVANLKSYEAFNHIDTGDNPPLLKVELENLDLLDKDVYSDIQSSVTVHCSFFDYKLLSFLVSRHGTEEEKLELKQYDQAFTEYAKRRVFEFPSEIGEMSKHCVTFGVKLDKCYERYTGTQLKLLEVELCEILGISDLKLIRIERGCIQLTFQIPVFVQQAIFPLSIDQEVKLKSLGILRLDCHCADYHRTFKVV